MLPTLTNAVYIATADGAGPVWTDIDFPETLRNVATGIGTAVIIIWLVFVAANVLMPGRRSGQGLRQMGAGKFILAAVGVMILLDLDLVNTIGAALFAVLGAIAEKVKTFEV